MRSSTHQETNWRLFVRYATSTETAQRAQTSARTRTLVVVDSQTEIEMRRAKEMHQFVADQVAGKYPSDDRRAIFASFLSLAQSHHEAIMILCSHERLIGSAYALLVTIECPHCVQRYAATCAINNSLLSRRPVQASPPPRKSGAGDIRLLWVSQDRAARLRPGEILAKF